MAEKIFHVEDDPEWRSMVEGILTKVGYRIISAGSFSQAKAMIPDSIRDVKVAILDGSLPDNHDGSEIADLIRQSGLAIAIIGLSGGPTRWADQSLMKRSLSSAQLLRAVKEYCS